MLKGPRYHKEIAVYTKEYPGMTVPLVLLSNGKPGFVINVWIASMLDQGTKPATLKARLSAVCKLYEFTMASHGNNHLNEGEVRSLLFRFGRARIYGTIQSDGSDPLGLWWSRVKRRTVKNELTNINRFNKFQQIYFEAQDLNPAEIYFKNALERFLEFQRRSKYDPFLHLFHSYQHVKTSFTVDIHTGCEDKSHGGRPFPPSMVVPLIESCTNPRDKMLLLLMAFGSLRSSETLCIYLSDVLGQFPDTGSAFIKLAYPDTGHIDWVDKNGQRAEGTRSFYLSKYFPSYPLPRINLGIKDPLYVGFKGMSFSGSKPDENFLFWSHEAAGQYFWKLFEEYREQYFFGKSQGWPYHPYLLITLNDDGSPLTMKGLRKIWDRAMKRVQLTGYGLHSLRHFYGHYCANVLDLPIERVSSQMHHASIESTKVYFKISPLKIRNEIIIAHYKEANKDVPKNLYQVEYKVDIPEHWSIEAREALILRIAARK